MFEHFSAKAIFCLRCAEEETRKLGESCYSTHTMILGIIRAEDEIASALLQKFGVELDICRTHLKGILHKSDQTVETNLGEILPFTLASKVAIESALAAAQKFGNSLVEPRHLLLGILNVELKRSMAGTESATSKMFAAQALDVLSMRSELERMMSIK